MDQEVVKKEKVFYVGQEKLIAITVAVFIVLFLAGLFYFSAKSGATTNDSPVPTEDPSALSGPGGVDPLLSKQDATPGASLGPSKPTLAPTQIPTPTVKPTVTPTPTPTPSPSSSPTPTASPSPTATPEVSPSPTPLAS